MVSDLRQRLPARCQIHSSYFSDQPGLSVCEFCEVFCAWGACQSQLFWLALQAPKVWTYQIWSWFSLVEALEANRDFITILWCLGFQKLLTICAWAFYWSDTRQVPIWFFKPRTWCRVVNLLRHELLTSQALFLLLTYISARVTPLAKSLILKSFFVNLDAQVTSRWAVNGKVLR